jgi:hypothetical protein
MSDGFWLGRISLGLRWSSVHVAFHHSRRGQRPRGLCRRSLRARGVRLPERLAWAGGRLARQGLFRNVSMVHPRHINLHSKKRGNGELRTTERRQNEGGVVAHRDNTSRADKVKMRRPRRVNERSDMIGSTPLRPRSLQTHRTACPSRSIERGGRAHPVWLRRVRPERRWSEHAVSTKHRGSIAALDAPAGLQASIGSCAAVSRKATTGHAQVPACAH